MNTYHVEYCYEEGGQLVIKANNPKEAEDKARELLDSGEFPEVPGEIVHRDYWTQGVTKIGVTDGKIKA